MTRMNRFAIAVLTAVMLAPVPTLAAEKPSYSKADKDGNGTVTLEEAKAAGIPAEEAKGNDLNNDGELTEADWRFVDMDEKGES